MAFQQALEGKNEAKGAEEWLLSASIECQRGWEVVFEMGSALGLENHVTSCTGMRCTTAHASGAYMHHGVARMGLVIPRFAV